MLASECKRATFLGARINSPVETLLHLLLSREPERAKHKQSHISAEGACGSERVRAARRSHARSSPCQPAGGGATSVREPG